MKLLKVGEAAKKTNLSIATWRAWILQKKVRVVRLGRSVRIPEDEVGRLVKEGMELVQQPLRSAGRRG